MGVFRVWIVACVLGAATFASARSEAAVWGDGGEASSLVSQQVMTSSRDGEVWVAWRPVVDAAGAKRALWVIPTPGAPRGWRVGSGGAFDELERLLQLRVAKRPGEVFGARAMRTAPDVAELDDVKVEVVPGRGADAARVVAERLEALGHEGAAAGLAYYAERGWWFTVVEVVASGGVSGAWPVVYGTYDGDRAVFPIRSFAGKGAADTRWYALTKDRLSKDDLASALAHGFTVAAAFGSPGAPPPKAYGLTARPMKASAARLSLERSPRALAKWLERAGWGKREQAWVRVFYRADLNEDVTLAPSAPDEEALFGRVGEDVSVPAAPAGERLDARDEDEAAEVAAPAAVEDASAQAKGAGPGCGSCVAAGGRSPDGAWWAWLLAWIGWRSRARFARRRDRIDSRGA